MSDFTLIAQYPDGSLYCNTIEDVATPAEAVDVARRDLSGAVERDGLTLIAVVLGEHIVYAFDDFSEEEP